MDNHDDDDDILAVHDDLHDVTASLPGHHDDWMFVLCVFHVHVHHPPVISYCSTVSGCSYMVEMELQQTMDDVDLDCRGPHSISIACPNYPGQNAGSAYRACL